MVSVPKYTKRLHLLFRFEFFFSGFKASQQNVIYLSCCQALDHFLPYNFLLLIFVDFFGKYSLFHLFKSRSSKERLILLL